MKPLEGLSVLHVFSSDVVPGLLSLAVRIVQHSQEGGDLTGWAVLPLDAKGRSCQGNTCGQDTSCCTWKLETLSNLVY